MSNYTTQRELIRARLASVSGIGRIYSHFKHAPDEAALRSAYAHNNVLNVCFFFREAISEQTDSEIASVTESNEQVVIDEQTIWKIRLHYAYNDEGSEDAFQTLIDNIRNAFRFQQQLGGYDAMPLQVVSTQMWQFLNGEVLTHRADFTLTLVNRIIK